MEIEVITREEARAWLARPVSRRQRLWDWATGQWKPGPKRRYPTRHPRGPGAAVDILNYGARNANGTLQAVARLGSCPYGGAPAKAAVGERLAPHTVYLMRMFAAGLSSGELIAFVRGWVARLPCDLTAHGHADKWYCLSLDDAEARLVHGASGVLVDTPPLAGLIYAKSGALDAGQTKSPRQPARYVEPDTGEIRSIYSSGRNLLPELRRRGARLISEGAKHRYVFFLADPGSPQYAAYRAALPPWVKDVPTERWVQPRLLLRLPRWINAIAHLSPAA